MARKEPFKRVSVADRIYDALDTKRLEESKDDFRPLPMNAYCEKILWDYAQGKLIRSELIQSGAGGARVVDVSGSWQSLDQPERVAEATPENRKGVQKRGHR